MSSIPTPKKRARLDLPFVKRRRDVVWWIYHHRAGIFTLVILAFGMAILFIGYKVVIRTPGPENAVMIDLRTIEQMQQEIARLERETRLRQEFAGVL